MSGLDFQVVEQKIFVLEDQITADDAKKKAEDKKRDGFGVISKFFSRPNADEIQLVYSEKRYEPFWYVLCTTHIEYNRSRRIEFEVAEVVRNITINEVKHDTPRGSKKMSIEGVEYCVEDLRKEIFLDANTGKEEKEFRKYVDFKRRDIPQTEELMSGDNIVVPVKVKASFIIRNYLTEMLKPVKADDILVEQIRIEKIHLFFRPVYAFEHHWKTKDKYATIEVDGLTQDVRFGGKAIKQKLKEAISETDLFELGTDVVDLFVPGGGLAIKLAKKGSQFLKKK